MHVNALVFGSHAAPCCHLKVGKMPCTSRLLYPPCSRVQQHHCLPIQATPADQLTSTISFPPASDLMVLAMFRAASTSTTSTLRASVEESAAAAAFLGFFFASMYAG